MNFPVPWRALLPIDALEVLTGKHGSVLKEICDETGASVTISGDGETPETLSDKIVTLSGAVEQKEAACRRCVDKLRVLQEVADQEPGVFVIIVPSCAAPMVVGQKGAQIKEVIELSGAEISVGKENILGMLDQPIGITGTGGQVVSAVSKVNAILQDLADRGKLQPSDFKYRPGAVPHDIAMGGPSQPGPRGFMSNSNPRTHAKFVVATQVAGWIIGKQGRHIRELQENSGSHIQVLKEGDVPPGVPPTDRIVEIGGRFDARAEGIQIVLMAIDSMPALQAPRETLMLVTRTLTQDPEIRDVQQMSGAEIEVRDLPGHGEALCTLLGTIEARVKAAQQFLTRLEELAASGASAEEPAPAAVPSSSQAPFAASAPPQREVRPREPEQERQQFRPPVDSNSFRPPMESQPATIPRREEPPARREEPPARSEPEPSRQGGLRADDPWSVADPWSQGRHETPATAPREPAAQETRPNRYSEAPAPSMEPAPVRREPSVPRFQEPEVITFRPDSPKRQEPIFTPATETEAPRHEPDHSVASADARWSQNQEAPHQTRDSPPGLQLGQSPPTATMPPEQGPPTTTMPAETTQPFANGIGASFDSGSGAMMSFGAAGSSSGGDAGQMSTFNPSGSAGTGGPMGMGGPMGGGMGMHGMGMGNMGMMGNMMPMGMMGMPGMGGMGMAASNPMAFEATLHSSMLAQHQAQLALLLPVDLLQQALIPQGHLADIAQKCQIQIDLGDELPTSMRQVSLTGTVAANTMAAYILQERSLQCRGGKM